MYTISADGAIVEGSISLKGATFRGITHFPAVTVKGQFAATAAVFHNPGEKALIAGGLIAEHGIFIDKITARGEVSFSGAMTGGQFVANDAQFTGPFPQSISLNIQQLSASRGLFLERIKAFAEVRVNGAKIVGGFVADNAEIVCSSPESPALSADGMAVEGVVRFHNASIKGELRFVSANIDGQFSIINSSLENPEGTALLAQKLHVRDYFILTNFKSLLGTMDLRGAQVGELGDDQSAWPAPNCLFLENFRYGSILYTRDRLNWIRLQRADQFYEQPYLQLAEALHRKGEAAEARNVLIAKGDDFRKYLKRFEKGRYWTRLSMWFLRRSIGYGYKRGLPALYIFIFVCFGWIFYYWADQVEIMQPVKERVYMDSNYIEDKKLPYPYPRLEPFWYSLDVFIPVIGFGQADYWHPDVTAPGGTRILDRPWGYWFRFYHWFHIIMGAILSSTAGYAIVDWLRHAWDDYLNRATSS